MDEVGLICGDGMGTGGTLDCSLGAMTLWVLRLPEVFRWLIG